jgi:hypothetical protein
VANVRIPYLKEYGSVNNGAHRQAADLVGAPAFIWHQALWKSVHGKDPLKERAETIESFIRAVHICIGKIPGSKLHTNDEIEVLPDDRAKVISFSFIWNDMRTRIRFEIHTEYITITSFIDASIKIVETPTSSLGKDVQKHLSAFIAGTCPTSDHVLPQYPAKPNINEVHEFIYNDIWDKNFFPQILNVSTKVYDGTIGMKFVDFRGFITCETYNASDYMKNECISSNDIYKNKGIQGPFYRKDEGERGQWQRTSIPDMNWARYRIDKVWPFLSVNLKDDDPYLSGRTEFTVSRMLDGRVLYVSALGPQPKQGSVSGNEQPLHFYMHSITQCERQIGRVVDRLTQMGTLRLAAIIPLPALKAVSEKLESVETEISRARDSTHDLIQLAKSPIKGDKKKLETTEQEILKNLDEIQVSMANLSEGRDSNACAYLGTATMEYRLIRSRVYKEMLFSLMDGLRIKRLEGYQPYDEFIKRRLGGAFGFIDGVERRIEQLKSEWQTLDQLYLTTTVNILTGEIDKQETETKNVQKSIEEIQLVGESLLIGLLAPYYLVNLVFHVFDCEHNEWCNSPNYLDKYMPIVLTNGQCITIVIMITAAILAVWRYLYNKHRKSQNNGI